MIKFVYKAKKNPTDIIEGSLTADSRASAIQKINQLGYFLISVDEEAAQTVSVPRQVEKLFLRRVGLRDITNFTRQFSDLLEGGLTIVKALDLLYNQTANKRFKVIISDMRDFCIDGNPFSAALERHPRVFSSLFMNMVRSGETAGALEKILKRLTEFNEKQLELQTKIRTALAYPILLSVIGLVTIIVLMTFVIPRLIGLFGDLGQALPLPTLILLNTSGFVTKYWWLLISAIFAVVLGTMRLYGTKKGKLAIDRFKLSFLIFGPLIRKVEVARFSRTLATLLDNGIPILDSIKVVSNTIDNAVVKEGVDAAYASVREGRGLAEGLANNKIIPAAVTSMIAVGEEGGRLERSLFKVAETYERESDEAVKVMMSLLEPLLILTLGSVVGFIVISILLPIFDLNFLLR